MLTFLSATRRRPRIQTTRSDGLRRRKALSGMMVFYFVMLAFGGIMLATSSPAVAWKAQHHKDLTQTFLDWHPLGDYLGTYTTHAAQAAYDVDNHNTDYGCGPTFKRYSTYDSHGYHFPSGGACTLSESHMNYAHSDYYGVENLFQTSYGQALSALQSGSKHAAAHYIGHMFHYLEDSAMILHTDCNEGVIDCLNFHGVHETNGKNWWEQGVYYCNKRLNENGGDCGRLDDVGYPGSMHYAFHNYPAFIESGDGKSDVAEMLTLNIHAQGWDAKDNWDLPDDAGDNRDYIGTDWYQQFQTKSCQSSSSTTCPVNRDIMMTGLWELARTARGVLDQLMLESYMGSSGLGDDQIEIIATKMMDLTPDGTYTGTPDLYIRFYIDRDGDYSYEYRGNTQQDQDNVAIIYDYTVASNTYTPRDSGSWLPPIPNPRGGTFYVRTELVDDDPIGNPNDERGTYYHYWSGSGSYGLNCQTTNYGTREVCLRATKTGNLWDTTAPSTGASVSGTSGSNGWYRSNTVITLLPSDSKSGVETTKYGYSASGPWYTYSSPRTLYAPGTDTLYYYSTDHYGNQESVKSTTVKMDTTYPSTSLSSYCSYNGLNGWCRASSESVTLSCSDSYSGCDKTYYSVDGGYYYQYSGTFSLYEGEHTVCYYSKDRAGNIGGTSCASIDVDPTPPSSSSSVSGSFGQNGWYTNAPTVTLSCYDATSTCGNTYYRQDAWGSFYTYYSPVSVYSDGSHSFQYYSKDDAGNTETTDTRTVKVDRNAPTTSPSISGTVGDYGWYKSTATVSLSCSDGAGSGCNNKYWNKDYTGWTTASGTFTVSNDQVTLQHYANDYAGLTESIKTSTIKSDSTLPSLSSSTSCSNPGSNGWCKGPVTISGSASDYGSGLRWLKYRVDSGSWQTLSGSPSYGIDGTHTITVEARDWAGNVRTNTHTVKIDQTTPTASIAQPAAGHKYVSGTDLGATPDRTTQVIGTLTIKVPATDYGSGVDRVEFYIVRGSTTTYCGVDYSPNANNEFEYSWSNCGTSTSAAQTVTVKAIAYDEAGLSTQVSRTVTKTA